MLLSTFFFEIQRLELQRICKAFGVDGNVAVEMLTNDLNDANIEESLRLGGYDDAITMRFLLRSWLLSYVQLDRSIANADLAGIMRALRHALVILVPTRHTK